MKFNFKKEASQAIDYILFPSIYYFIDEQKKNEDELLEQVISEEYMSFIEKITTLLEPYKDEISKFYNEDIYATYDFSNILIHGFPIYDYHSEHEYLRDLSKMNEADLRRVMIKTLLTMDDDEGSEEDYRLNEATAISYINGLNIDSSNKWNLLMMIQKPKDYLKDFIALLEKVQSLFYSYYEKKVSEATEYGMALAKRLSEDTENTFKEITHDAIHYDFSESENCYLYVSVIFPYSLRFSNDDDCRIIWGMNMEKSWKKLYEIREDKLSERVKIFKALGDKTRYGTLKLLASGESSIKEIANKLDVSSATISYHVNEFLTSGIVNLKLEKSKKSGYKVDYDKLEEVMMELKSDLNFPE
ncbi:helix-turn-helix domain-containing protein [Mycoplasmatota bacterium]|nr:helix-turn-helix domain-containing protein [Mycoplasmatota bacterium]